ncbi:MAG: 4'-phosphopantetheinyl transferase superfamily protein [Candidatus Caenarcaniphilales bacterium]|nr:4'-phosphopantetheinyl transferase superfamily protein [Candidatus Caenarcaniphilales bacterium]
MEIFIANLNDFLVDESFIQNCLLLFSESERQRFLSSKSLKSQKEFLIGRVILRSLLAQKLNCQANQIIIENSSKGRPEVVFPKTTLSFSLSHSAGCLVLIISSNNVAIDLEFLKLRDFKRIAEKNFSKKEKDFINSNPVVQNFYVIWTLKEALAKLHSESIFTIMKKTNFIVDLKNKEIKTDFDNNLSFETFELQEKFIFSIAKNKTLNLLNQSAQNAFFCVKNILPLVTHKIKNPPTLYKSQVKEIQ